MALSLNNTNFCFSTKHLNHEPLKLVMYTWRETAKVISLSSMHANINLHLFLKSFSKVKKQTNHFVQKFL